MSATLYASCWRGGCVVRLNCRSAVGQYAGECWERPAKSLKHLNAHVFLENRRDSLRWCARARRVPALYVSKSQRFFAAFAAEPCATPVGTPTDRGRVQRFADCIAEKIPYASPARWSLHSLRRTAPVFAAQQGSARAAERGKAARSGSFAGGSAEGRACSAQRGLVIVVVSVR